MRFRTAPRAKIDVRLKHDGPLRHLPLQRSLKLTPPRVMYCKFMNVPVGIRFLENDMRSVSIRGRFERLLSQSQRGARAPMFESRGRALRDSIGASGKSRILAKHETTSC